MSQFAYKVPADAKRALLEHLVRSRNLTQVLCFVRTKHGTARLARQLEKDGLVTDAIHGDKTQQARMEALAAFKEGKLQVLVATDVAARGLDIDDLPLVVNYELPHVPEDYIHRIGRTGRAGRLGRSDLVRRAGRGALPRRHRAAAEEEGRGRRCRRLRYRGHRPEQAANARRVRSRRRRPARAPHEAAKAKGARRRRRAPRHRERSAPRPPSRPSAGDSRREERERAYALNPDQPTPARPAPSPAHPHGRKHFGHGKPVPALLMKRKTAEPEKV